MFGGASVMSFPSSQMRPESGRSKPPSIRSKVVLPQPDGPRREKNSPFLMENETSSTAVSAPKRFVTWSNTRNSLANSIPLS